MKRQTRVKDDGTGWITVKKVTSTMVDTTTEVSKTTSDEEDNFISILNSGEMIGEMLQDHLTVFFGSSETICFQIPSWLIFLLMNN